MNNILQAILGVLPVAEQVALLFIHNAESTHKFSIVTGEVNQLAPIAAGIVSALAAPKPASPVTTLVPAA